MNTSEPFAETCGKLQTSDHRHCLLCGWDNPISLGLTFHAGTENGEVRTRLESQPVWQGYDGLLHGGVSAALLDAAMTHCLFHLGIRAMTADLQIRYLRPIPCDAPLLLRAWPQELRPPLYRLTAEIRVDTTIMARAQARFILRKSE